jgi:hypothetical protein
LLLLAALQGCGFIAAICTLNFTRLLLLLLMVHLRTIKSRSLSMQFTNLLLLMLLMCAAHNFAQDLHFRELGLSVLNKEPASINKKAEAGGSCCC